MSVYNSIQSELPFSWSASNLNVDLAIVPYNSSEFLRVSTELGMALVDHRTVTSIRRVQNVYHYGQFLIREQLLAATNTHLQYYRVRRFVTLPRRYLNDALKYNMDPRRCQLGSLDFRKYISCPSFPEHVIFLVIVLTDNPNPASIKPTNSHEFFIEYIIEL